MEIGITSLRTAYCSYGYHQRRRPMLLAAGVVSVYLLLLPLNMSDNTLSLLAKVG